MIASGERQRAVAVAAEAPTRADDTASAGATFALAH
jgi:hypothetical protein